MKTTLQLAEEIARMAHAGQFRRDGVTPYITHPERVVARLKSQGVTDEIILAVAWLHDVAEDTDFSITNILSAGEQDELFEPLIYLTKEEGESYEAYLNIIAHNPTARTVKIADILDNLSDAPTEKQIIKYAKALLYLHGQ